MTYDELNGLNAKFQSIFGVSMWRYQDKWFGFDIIQFETEKCQGIVDGVSTKQYVFTRWGKEAVELIETCLELGNWMKITSKIDYQVLEASKKYMGATKCRLELPLVSNSRYYEPIFPRVFDAYMLGCFAAIKDDKNWSITHLPSKMSCAARFKSAKSAINFMKCAVEIEGIDQFPLPSYSLTELAQLVSNCN
jgi:hypothetical protein